MGGPDRKLEPREAALMRSVGAIFKEAREENDLSQREAARNASTGQARISYLEQGKVDMQVTTLQKLAEAYGYELEIALVIPPDEFEQALADVFGEPSNDEEK